MLLSEDLQKMRAERPESWQMDRFIRAAAYLELEKSKAEQLLAAAQAVIKRWDSPMWKHQEHTGKFIDELRKAVARFDGNLKGLEERL